MDLVDIVTAPLDALNWLTDEIFLFLNGLYNRFGVPIVFFAALIEATVGLGIVFPGVALMFLGGAYAADDPAQLAVVLAIAIIGTVLGDTVSYELGRRSGRLLEGSRFSGRLGPTMRLGESLIRGNTRWIIPVYHLHSFSRAIGPFGAGAIGMPRHRWMPLDYLGAVLSDTVWVGAGALFGTAILTADGRLEEHPALRIGLAAAAFAWFYFVQGVLTRRWRELASVEEPSEPEPARE